MKHHKKPKKIFFCMGDGNDGNIDDDADREDNKNNVDAVAGDDDNMMMAR
jgi:hypothetical protein